MRLFGIQPDGKLSEYTPQPFQVEHEESVLEGWLESSPDGIVEEGRVLIIGRQVVTNFGGFIDLLGLDRRGDVVVVELKRDRTPRETLAQALEYASFVERLDAEQLADVLRSYQNDPSLNLADYHRKNLELSPDEAVTFNKDQRIVIVGQRVTPEIRQTASFLRSKGIRVTCVEFAFFQANGGTRLVSQEIVVGREADKPARVSSGSLPVVTEESFLASVDENGKAVFSRILGFARDRAMPLHWGSKGFSLNVDLDGVHVAIGYGYPPHSANKQVFYTALRGQGGMFFKTAVPEEVIKTLWAQAEATGLFRPAGHEMKCLINRRLTEEEISSLLSWLAATAQAVREYGLKE